MDKATFDSLWDLVSAKADPTMVDSDQGRFIQQHGPEFWKLVQRVTDINPQRILEIGNACGGTTLFWKALAPQVVSIDLEPVGDVDGYFSADQLEGVHFILGSSHDSEVLEQAKEFAPYDFLFIDGDHETAGVRMDWDMYAPLVREGGIVAFHDWLYHLVREAIDSIGKPDEVISLANLGIAIFRK